jgi:hypothetical protein
MSAFFRFLAISKWIASLIKRDGAARRRFAEAKRETKKLPGDNNVASLVKRDGAARRRFAEAKRETKKASGRQ